MVRKIGDKTKLWFAWMRAKPYHVMRTDALGHTNVTECGHQLDRDKWWYTQSRPLGERMCESCRKSRGKFEAEKDVMKQTKLF